MRRDIQLSAPYAYAPAGDSLVRHGSRILTETLRVWRRRARTRRELAQLDGRLLADIGIDAEHARNEAAKPFWKA